MQSCLHACHFVCAPYQREVGFGDGAVLEAAVGPAGSRLVEGDAKSSAGGEVQLMTEPGETTVKR